MQNLFLKQSKHGIGGLTMENCEACKELSKVYDGSQQLLTAKFTNHKTGLPTFILTQEKYGKEPQSVVIQVNYCPWCGGYLRGAEDGK